MIEKNDLFDYGYYIYQNKDYFKFSIDSILLSEFIKIKDNKEVLDLCTGNAPIPLILTAKNKKLSIDAVEIQKEIYELAKESVKVNKLSNINVYLSDIKEFKSNKKYDIITCNPPYFKYTKTSEKNSNSVKRIARHEEKIKLDEIISIAVKHLKENGTFYMVHRTERFIDVVLELSKNKLGIRDICFVYTKENSNAEFFLIESSKSKKTDPKIRSINTVNLKSYKGIFEEE